MEALPGPAAGGRPSPSRTSGRRWSPAWFEVLRGGARGPGLYTHRPVCVQVPLAGMNALAYNVFMTRNRNVSPASNPRRVVGYIRVSTDDQTLGPIAQREALARWCTANGAELVTVIEEPHRAGRASGGADLEDRPGMLSAIDALAEHGAGVLLVAKRDRLARDPMVAAMIERLAERHGARVLSIAGEGTEGTDPTAILMRRIVDAFAEYERLIIRQRTRTALAVKSGRGERTGQVPYGSHLAADGVHLEADPGEQRVIELVRALRAEGLSIRAIAARLEADAVPARGGRWHPTTIARLVDREAA